MFFYYYCFFYLPSPQLTPCSWTTCGLFSHFFRKIFQRSTCLDYEKFGTIFSDDKFLSTRQINLLCLQPSTRVAVSSLGIKQVTGIHWIGLFWAEVATTTRSCVDGRRGRVYLPAHDRTTTGIQVQRWGLFRRVLLWSTTSGFLAFHESLLFTLCAAYLMRALVL